MQECKYCRICLAFDVKMYSSAISSINDAYLDLLRNPIPTNVILYFCFECSNYLLKYYAFRLKCLKAHKLISDSKFQITKNIVIQSIDRKQNKLISNLSYTTTTFEEFIDNTDLLHSDHKLTNSDVNCEDKPSMLKSNDDLIVKKENRTSSPEVEDYTDFVQNDTLHDKYDDDDDLPLNKIANKSTEVFVNKKQSIKSDKKRNFKKIAKNICVGSKDNCDSKNNIPNKTKTRENRRNTFNASYFEHYGTIENLTPEDARKEVLLRKETSNFKNCPYRCELCYRGYESKVTFENHMKRHDPQFGKFACEYCHLRYSTKSLLCTHHFSCHKRKFCCNICPYVCFCISQARNHVDLHKGKKYPCEECGEIFSMPNSLHMHKRFKHSTECVCDLCGSTFGKDKGLLSHKRLLHKQESNRREGPKCNECSVHFATETAWKRHLVMSSKHKVKNGCKYCGETYQDVSGLKEHLKVHARNQRHLRDVNFGMGIRANTRCTICCKQFSSKSEYRFHIRVHHPQSELARELDASGVYAGAGLQPGAGDAADDKRCVCEVCGKVFQKRCFLQYHQRRHTGERPYQCRECGKRYAVRSALNNHSVSHYGNRVHKCELCDKMFKSRSALGKHVKAHLGIRPHKCTICEKSFPNQCDVKTHMKYVHFKVPWPKRDRSKRLDPATVLQHTD